MGHTYSGPEFEKKWQKSPLVPSVQSVEEAGYHLDVCVPK